MRREMLTDLAKLGFHFRALEAFVESTCGADAFLQNGLYRHALASGLTGMGPLQMVYTASPHRQHPLVLGLLVMTSVLSMGPEAASSSAAGTC